MQTGNKKSLAVISLLVAMCATLFSFTVSKGGDSFEIYLNKKLVFQQFVSQMKHVNTLSLQQSNYNDLLTIHYSHCGKTGKNRTIIIKDSKENVLKQWHFADAGSNLSFKVNEIFDLQKDEDNHSLNLYYSSRELPDGRLLATIHKGNDNSTKP